MNCVRYHAHRLRWHGSFVGIISTIGVLIIVECQFVPHSTPPALNQAEIDAFFKSQVHPALDAYQIRNNKTVDQAVDRISRDVEEYRDGIEPLVEDITSWGTRFGIIRHMGSDLGEQWWGNPTNATAVHCYVSEKFETHLFSDTKLNVAS